MEYRRPRRHPNAWLNIPRRQAQPRQKRNGFIWPNDGKRRGWFGGLKDILSGQGPDIHVGNIRSGHPYVERWSRWPEWEFYEARRDGSKEAAPWAQRGMKRYDFHTRKYRNWGPDRWLGPNDSQASFDSSFDFGPNQWEPYWQWDPLDLGWRFVPHPGLYR